MRFLMTTTAADPPDEKMVAEMDRLVEEMTASKSGSPPKTAPSCCWRNS